MKDDRSPKNYIPDDPAKNDLGSTEMMSLPLWFIYLVLRKKSLILDGEMHDINLQIDLWSDTKHLPSWPLKPRLCSAHRPERRRIQNNIISFNNAIGTSDKGTQKMAPPLFFLHVPKVPSNEPKVCAPRRPGRFKVFLEAGFQLPHPPQKNCERSYACETLERMFGACAKGDGRTVTDYTSRWCSL